MPRYVVLYRFSDQGLKSIKGTVKRAAEIRADNEKRGFKTIGVWWTQGAYDLVAVMESPTEEAMVAGLFNVAETGNVHSETMRAFDASEMDGILKQA